MSINRLLQRAFSFHREGRLDLAETYYLQVIKTAPEHWSARFGLAQVLVRMNRFDAAIRWLTPLLNDTDDSVAVHRELGLAQARAGRPELALEHFVQILDDEPDDPETLHVVANLQQLLGMDNEADAHYRRALKLKPLVNVPAAVTPPDFSVLFVFAPGRGNTPFTYLVEGARFESNVISLLADFEYDIEELRAHGDVVVNLIADVDQGRALLGPAEALVERIGKPIANHPRLIADTGRDSIARRLAETPGCRVPQTRLFPAYGLRAVLSDAVQYPLTFPLLARPAGTHGGDDFEKLEDSAQLSAFVDRYDERDCYLTPFVDYRSDDGYFRKYRFVYVDGEILPYHLAIGDHWKVHHVTTGMAHNLWMQAEEQMFLENPWRVFGVSQYTALRLICDTIGLDYFGIDCALDRDGAIVVFEVNACMLVHGNNGPFVYKTEAVERIKHAFHAMLESRARNAFAHTG